MCWNMCCKHVVKKSSKNALSSCMDQTQSGSRSLGLVRLPEERWKGRCPREGKASWPRACAALLDEPPAAYLVAVAQEMHDCHPAQRPQSPLQHSRRFLNAVSSSASTGIRNWVHAPWLDRLRWDHNGRKPGYQGISKSKGGLQLAELVI